MTIDASISGIRRFLPGLLLLIFSGCACREHQDSKYTFTSEDLVINPYQKNELFTLSNLSGDSVQYLVSNRISTMEKAFGNSDECDRAYDLYESNFTTILSKDYIWRFGIRLNSFPAYQDSAFYHVIGFDQWTNSGQSDLLVASIGLLYRNGTLYNNQGSTSAPIIYHKTISLGPRSFDYTYEISMNLQQSGVEYWATTIFYSVKQGLVGFKTNNDELWYLSD